MALYKLDYCYYCYYQRYRQANRQTAGPSNSEDHGAVKWTVLMTENGCSITQIITVSDP